MSDNQPQTVTGRVFCPVNQTWHTFSERLAWMTEPLRQLALQLGFPIRDIYRAAMVGAHVGLNAIPEAEIIWEEHLDALHDRVRLRGKLSITDLLSIAMRARLALARLICLTSDPAKRANLEAKLAEIDEVRADNARMAQEMLERMRKVN
jgi:hypothetical protein